MRCCGLGCNRERREEKTGRKEEESKERERGWKRDECLILYDLSGGIEIWMDGWMGR